MPKLNRGQRYDDPDPVDIHVGSRIRLRRTLLGLSQDKLAKDIGVSFQQLQKYERGTNRVSASRLYALAQVLDVTVGWFFEETRSSARRFKPHDTTQAKTDDPMASRETVKLVSAYYRIKDAKVRRSMLAMMRTVGSGGMPSVS
jgi:transcriptional regulator with XRE-family HTH domain